MTGSTRLEVFQLSPEPVNEKNGMIVKGGPRVHPPRKLPACVRSQNLQAFYSKKEMIQIFCTASVLMRTFSSVSQVANQWLTWAGTKQIRTHSSTYSKRQTKSSSNLNLLWDLLTLLQLLPWRHYNLQKPPKIFGYYSKFPAIFDSEISSRIV